MAEQGKRKAGSDRTDTPAQTSPRRQGPMAGAFGGMGLVLVLSLALNLLLIGVLGGAYLRDWRQNATAATAATGGAQAVAPGRVPARQGGPQPDRKIITLGLRPYWRAMSPPERAALARAVRAQRKQLRSGLAGPRVLMRDFIRAVQSDPLDKAALESVFARQSALVAARVAAGQKALAARIEAMSPAARKEFARRLIDARKIMRRGRKGMEQGMGQGGLRPRSSGE